MNWVVGAQGTFVHPARIMLGLGESSTSSLAIDVATDSPDSFVDGPFGSKVIGELSDQLQATLSDRYDPVGMQLFHSRVTV